MVSIPEKIKINNRVELVKNLKFECPFFYQYIYRMFNPLRTQEINKLRDDSITNKRRHQTLPIDEDCFVNQSLKANHHDLIFKKIEFKPNLSDKVNVKKGFKFENMRIKKHENIFLPMVFTPLKVATEHSLGKMECLWKRMTSNEKYIFSNFEEKDSFTCEFVNPVAQLTYNDIPDANIGAHMEIKYNLKNRMNVINIYTISCEESIEFFVTGTTKFD